MEFKVIWSEAAIGDLQDICSYIARDNPQAAERIGHGILDHVRILQSFPFIGPTYPKGARGHCGKSSSVLIASSTTFRRRARA
jgi:plasmid stabilization system protein ParE